jgi:hypothetical protein
LVIDNFGEIAGSWLAATLGLLAFGLFWGYYILFETIWNGRSPGKRWVGLRVIKMDGTPINLTESIIRNFIRLIDFLPLNYGVGIVCMFLNKDSRRLGDLAAGTLVVFDQREVSLKDLGQAVRSVPTPAATGIQVDLPVSQLDEDEIQVIELYLRRRNEITPGFDLADQILARCLDKMALAEPPRAGYSSHLWLLEILRQWRQYHQPRESGPGSY